MTGVRPIVFVAVLILLFVNAQTPPNRIVQILLEHKLGVADLRNEWLAIVFPEQLRSRIEYQRPESEYVYSIIAPTGRALFAVRRTFYQSSPPKDTLLRRVIGASIGREEVIPIPFVAIFQCAASPNEKLILIAGRLSEGSDKRDGIFLVQRGDGKAEFVAPYVGGGLNESIRSLNVNDQGDMIVYEDGGSIVEFAGPRGHWTVGARSAGRFPALMPDGRTYVYSDNGWLIENVGKERHRLFRLPEITGAIRASPDGGLIEFGTRSPRKSSITQLRICELRSGDCVDGPKYSEWIAGREAFWIQR
ncbi:MAG TPA: hypothetical protein VMT15_20855 [Bryobacteraceae bacterium]|nr:hypothetical protein [Bryobacteraceae bacterium]